MKYYVSCAIEGRIDVEVEAENLEEAAHKARIEAGNTNWNAMDFVDISAVNAEDENGNFHDY